MTETRTVLTESQERVLEAVRTFIDANGISPTTRELAAMLSISAASIHEQLARLERKGVITRKPRKARSVEIVTDGDNPAEEEERNRTSLVRVPVLGRIAAGEPIFAHEEYGSEIFIDESNIGTGRFFALEVSGDSMKDADINNGDLVVVKRQPVADRGEIVAALIDDEATVKRLRVERGSVLLQPENERYDPIDVTCRDDFRILGVVVSVISTPSQYSDAKNQ